MYNYRQYNNVIMIFKQKLNGVYNSGTKYNRSISIITIIVNYTGCGVMDGQHFENKNRQSVAPHLV